MDERPEALLDLTPSRRGFGSRPRAIYTTGGAVTFSIASVHDHGVGERHFGYIRGAVLLRSIAGANSSLAHTH